MAKQISKKAQDAYDWFGGLDLEAATPETILRGKHYNHSVSIFLSKDGKTFYLHTRSPQQRGRWSGTVQGQGTTEDIKRAFQVWVMRKEKKEQIRLDKLAAKKEARLVFENPYKVGDFLYSSWGYEFYQVLDVHPRSIKIQEVAQNREYVFLERSGSAKWVTIQIRNGSHSIPSPIYGDLYPYDGKPKSFSSYA